MALGGDAARHRGRARTIRGLGGGRLGALSALGASGYSAVTGGSGRSGLRLYLGWLFCRLLRGLAHADLGQPLAHGDGIALVLENAGQHAIFRRAYLDVHFVGFQLHQRLARRHRVALGLAPLPHRRLDDGFAKLRYRDIS